MLKSTNKTLIKLALAGAAVLSLLFASTTLAADLRFDNTRNPNFEVAQNDHVANLYTAGSQVVVNASPSKDLVVGGGTVIINGNVARSVMAAGGHIDLKGDVGGSARIVGGSINVNSKNIAEDLVVAGGTVYISNGTVINGDLIVAGANVTLDGTVHGSIKAAGGTLSINGTVDGNVDAKVNSRLFLGSAANIKGDLNYSSPYTYQRDQSAQVAGQVNYNKTENHANKERALLTVGFFIKLFGEILFAWFLYFVFRNTFRTAVERVGWGFWKNVGFGLLFLIGVPVVIGILLITIIGWYAAIILGLVYILALMFAWLIAASYFGAWAVAKFDKREMHIDLVTIGVGIVLAALLKEVPVLGGIFAVILALAGLGIFLRHYRRTE